MAAFDGWGCGWPLWVPAAAAMRALRGKLATARLDGSQREPPYPIRTENLLDLERDAALMSPSGALSSRCGE